MLTVEYSCFIFKATCVMPESAEITMATKDTNLQPVVTSTVLRINGMNTRTYFGVLWE